MKKAIIFDFNRTLYDPERGGLMSGAVDLLTQAQSCGFSLFLLTQNEGQRRSLIESLGLTLFFDRIVFTDNKTIRQFELLIYDENINVSESLVIGDRVRTEIYFGNYCGMKTIWLKQGKFANELPQTLLELPTYVVKQLKECVPYLL